MKKYPNSRLGWHKYYVARFEKTSSAFALQLATWFLLLHEAFGERATTGEAS